MLVATRMTLGVELKDISLPLNVSTSISLRVRYQLFMLDPDKKEASMVIKQHDMDDMEVFDQNVCMLYPH